MRSLAIICLMFLSLLACKDNAVKEGIDNQDKAAEIEESMPEPRWDPEEYYKPRISNDGDTLIPKIPQDSVEAFFTRYALENPENEVEINTDFGVIRIRLYDQPAVYKGSFLFLVKNGYFDSTYFYRVAKGFVIQAGNSDQTFTTLLRSSAGNYRLEPDFSNERQHNRGTVSMARMYEKNPDKLMDAFVFFICMKKSPHLDGEHVVIGEVLSGMDTASRINKVAVDGQEWPLNDVKITMKVVK